MDPLSPTVSSGIVFTVRLKTRNQFNSHSLTNEMSLPVRPPMLPRALLTLDAAPLRAGLAEEVTRERPCEALDVALDAASLDLAAVLVAASVTWEVAEACR